LPKPKLFDYTHAYQSGESHLSGFMACLWSLSLVESAELATEKQTTSVAANPRQLDGDLEFQRVTEND
jgi:hypothetical protein